MEGELLREQFSATQNGEIPYSGPAEKLAGAFTFPFALGFRV